MLAHTYTHLYPHRSIMCRKAKKQLEAGARPNHHLPQCCPCCAMGVHYISIVLACQYQPTSPQTLLSWQPLVFPLLGHQHWQYLNPTFLLLHISGTCTTSAPRCLTRKYPANLHVVCRKNSLMTLSLIVFPAKCCLLLLSEQSALMISSST